MTAVQWSDGAPIYRQLKERVIAMMLDGVLKPGDAAVVIVDGKIADVLAKCGIADCFLTITDSGIVGHEKPHPAIFEAAFREMNASPEESLYVGDVYSVDYLGATQAGMQAVLFDVAGTYCDAGWPRVDSLEELALMLEKHR